MSSDPHQYLWENICTLMGETRPEPSIDRVRARVKVGRGTVQRMHDRTGSPRLESLVTIAENLGVPVWQLLMPGGRLDSGLSEAANELGRVYDGLPAHKQRQLYIMVQIAQNPEVDPASLGLAPTSGRPALAEPPTAAPASPHAPGTAAEAPQPAPAPSSESPAPAKAPRSRSRQ